MSQFETAQFTEAYRGKGEDRIAVITDDERIIIIVADGAGGMGYGDLAAESVIREIRSDYLCIGSPEQWEAKLRQVDHRIPAGEATAVAVDVRPDRICGASVGDSQAWLIDDGNHTNLTIHQHRKPLLGSRNASPVGFCHPALAGLLIVATDGFCNYVNRERLLPAIAKAGFFSIPRTCVELVRLPSGELWDDIGIVACRLRPRYRTRKRYSI